MDGITFCLQPLDIVLYVSFDKTWIAYFRTCEGALHNQLFFVLYYAIEYTRQCWLMQVHCWLFPLWYLFVSYCS